VPIDVSVKRVLTVTIFVISLFVLLVLILGAVVAGTWVFAEVFDRLFPLDYARVDHTP